MKKATFSKALFWVMALAVTAFTFVEPEQSGKINSSYSDYSGRIIGFRELTLLPDTKSADLERFAEEQLTPTFGKQIPGMVILKA